MREKKGILLALILCLPIGSAIGATKYPGDHAGKELAEVALTTDQAELIVRKLEDLINQALSYDQINRAPRPDSAHQCDGSFPGCSNFDLSELSACSCAIKNLLCCLGSSILDVLGACTDESILLPSMVDKSDIDAICASTVTLLKTILLELRGSFTSIP